MQILHEDTFHEFFMPYRHEEAKHQVWGGLGLETFGADYQLVRSLDPKFVWTVIEDGVSDDLWITQGIHHVNRICYLVTEISHSGFDVEFRCRHRPTTLSSLGLKRQINTLKRQQICSG